MTLPANIRDREQNKFKETIGGNVAVRTCIDTSGGAIPVDPTGVAGVITNIFDETTTASASTATIASYTIPSNKEFKINRIEFSGNNIARYFIEINSIKEAQKRTWFGGDLSGDFVFDSLLVDENIVISLKVENFRPTSGDFEGRILGVLDDK